MKLTEFIVKFLVGEPITVYAFNKEDAKILAMAEKIKVGLLRDVCSVEKTINMYEDVLELGYEIGLWE